MADEISNANVGSSTNDQNPVVVAQTSAELASHIENSIQNPGVGPEKNVVVNDPPMANNGRSTSNNLGSIVAVRQYVKESHHDLVNLLTQ
ncbi:hypothetical protein Ahy_A09g045018 isoform B [Arachis hypogaea]|uniref:Uncharacterized protein n=1 Tax=Arachis hypogaea TaxID=3818 RepID=A0A445BLB6_ARAHY|nr:hypothetical protein Ahy_A09g045018 isoform B [Arachis hypogaea]